MSRIGAISLLVHDYDAAIAFYVAKLVTGGRVVGMDKKAVAPLVALYGVAGGLARRAGGLVR